jgi:hypothetical protein
MVEALDDDDDDSYMQTDFVLLYSNSMCKQSSMPTSILMDGFSSGSWRQNTDANSRRRSAVARARTHASDYSGLHGRSPAR